MERNFDHRHAVMFDQEVISSNKIAEKEIQTLEFMTQYYQRSSRFEQGIRQHGQQA